MNQEFDEIRPYYDEELPAVYEELIADPAFRQVAGAAMPDLPFDRLAALMRSCKTKQDFQVNICYNILKRIIREATQGVTFDNSAQPDRGSAYTYVSNHRDIVLDSGFLSLMLVEQGQDTVEIAIGDNLLIRPWIKKLVRVDKAFIVQRSAGLRQMLASSARMSRYMHYAIGTKHENIWIAQREGRAKDSDDRTQDAILKMMAMGGEGSITERLKQLNLTPVALSYEYDPCDYLKAQEFQQKRDIEGFKKSPADDLLNMQTGIFGYKGRICFRMAECLNGFLDSLPADLPRTELFDVVAKHIDREIHRNYELYPGNYAAADLLRGTQDFARHYTAEERAQFEAYLEGQVRKVTLPQPDTAFLRERLLTMYANPVFNHEAAVHE